MTNLQKFYDLSKGQQVTDASSNVLSFPLASGSFGSVYLQYDKQKDLIYILKNSTIPLDKSELKKALMELTFLYTLERYCDPYIICPYKVYEFTKTNTNYDLNFLMEYVGPSLASYLKYNSDKLNVIDYLLIMTRLLEGLHFINSKGFIHKDIKLDNIVFNYEKLQPKYIDFGGSCMDTGIVRKAYLLPEQKELAVTQQDMLACYGVLIGTPEYMSPEIFVKTNAQAQLSEIRIKPATKDEKIKFANIKNAAQNFTFDEWIKSDIWSLGVTLYKLITGVSPFRPPGKFTIIDIMTTISRKRVDLLEFKSDSPITSEVISLVGELVNDMINKNPKDRPTLLSVITQMHQILYIKLVGGKYNQFNYDMEVNKYVETRGPLLAPSKDTPVFTKPAKTLNDKQIRKLVDDFKWNRAIQGLSSYS